MRPFFGFYGGKWRDALKHYPPPDHDTVVEPFAGSAGYAVRYAGRRVILGEIDPVIYGVWEYLISVKASEILAIPDVEPGQSVNDLPIPQEARWLVGFWLNRGASRPRIGPSAWMRDGIRPGSFWGERVRQMIATQVDLVRHWEVHNTSYEDLPFSGKATWFIDPPYQKQGQHYRFGAARIDYPALGEWCRTRQGQVIVCENEGADWLPFTPLAVEQMVAEQGQTLDDVSVAKASWGEGSITAMRLAGGDAIALFGPLLAGMFTGNPFAEWTSGQVAGKDVMTIPFGSGSVYLRPQGEVVWGVSAEEPALTEIFTALP